MNTSGLTVDDFRGTSMEDVVGTQFMEMPDMTYLSFCPVVGFPPVGLLLLPDMLLLI